MDNSHGQSLVTNRNMISECSRKYVVAGQPPLVSPGEGGDRTRGNKSCQLEPIIVLFELGAPPQTATAQRRACRGYFGQDFHNYEDNLSFMARL